MKILGVKIDNLSQKEILEKIESFLADDGWHQIATINPEFILRAQKEEEFRNILNKCDLNVADGIGIRFASWRFGKFLQCRMAGADLMLEILKIADEKKLPIFLVASSGGLSGWEETAEAIKKKYPSLEISGMNLDKNTVNFEPRTVNCDVIFCSFGAPEQEKFIHSLKNEKNAKIRLAMGVGGSFDYLTGKVRRAPKILQKMGLEWLWRLIQQPQRIKRIWNAVIIFPRKIMLTKKITMINWKHNKLLKITGSLVFIFLFLLIILLRASHLFIDLQILFNIFATLIFLIIIINNLLNSVISTIRIRNLDKVDIIFFIVNVIIMIFITYKIFFEKVQLNSIS